MRWLLIGLLMCSHTLALSAPPTDCGETPATAPRFELVDANPSSATNGTVIRSDDLKGNVWVVYWAQSS